MMNHLSGTVLLGGLQHSSLKASDFLKPFSFTHAPLYPFQMTECFYVWLDELLRWDSCTVAVSDDQIFRRPICLLFWFS